MAELPCSDCVGQGCHQCDRAGVMWREYDELGDLPDDSDARQDAPVDQLEWRELYRSALN
jgi:hypothetical protein